MASWSQLICVFQCPTFSYRRVCSNCKCTKEDHEVGNNKVMNEKLKELNIATDDNESLNDLSQYAWHPAGLEPDLVKF